MEPKIIFLLVWLGFVVFIIFTFYKKGQKALSIFPDISSQSVKFHDKKATGNSTEVIRRKAGSARTSIEIIVTDKELWIKSSVMTAFIASQRDILHKILIKNIFKISRDNKKILIDFKIDNGDKKQIILSMKNSEDFLKSLKK